VVIFVVRRLAGLVLTLLAVSLVVFLVLEVLPGDVAEVILGTEAREDTLAALREQLGLSRPAHVRYLAWIGGFMTGDLGLSHTYGVPVAALIGERLAVTVPLALIAFVLSTAIALPLGLFAASRRGRAGDWGVMAFSQAGLAIPNFWFAILLILVFAVWLRWLPASGFPGWDTGVLPCLRALLLPALALALTEAAILSRIARSSVLECLGEDYVRTARAKGLGRRAVLWRHVLRNALIPVTTIMGLQFAFLLAGAVIVENVFTLPGLGRLVLQAIFQRDVIVVKNAVMLLAFLVVLVNFAVDLIYGVIDPRPKAAA
jgi:peptide/nickel transport system permease protein